MPPVVTRKQHAGAASPATLTGGVNTTDLAWSLSSTAGWPDGSVGSFYVVVDPGTVNEEKVLAASTSGLTLNIVGGGRGADGTTAKSHSPNAVVYPCIAAAEIDELNAHANAGSAVHGITGAVVGTTDTQTITGKSISGSANTLSNIPQSAVTGLSTALAPVGSIVMWPTATPPTNWLVCDGSTFSAATYPALNTVLGGTTLPNFSDRAPVGKSGTKGLLSTGGSATFTLTTNELPAHTHTSASHAHLFSAVTGSSTVDASASTAFDTSPTSTTRPVGQATGSFTTFTISGSGHNHTVSGTTNSATPGPTGSAGSGAAFSLQNPFLAVTFIIKAA